MQPTKIEFAPPTEDFSPGFAARMAAPPRPVWLNGGAASLDAAGGILSANDSLAAWLGATPGEMYGQCLATVVGQRHAVWEQPLR